MEGRERRQKGEGYVLPAGGQGPGIGEALVCHVHKDSPGLLMLHTGTLLGTLLCLLSAALLRACPSDLCLGGGTSFCLHPAPGANCPAEQCTCLVSHGSFVYGGRVPGAPGLGSLALPLPAGSGTETRVRIARGCDVDLQLYVSHSAADFALDQRSLLGLCADALDQPAEHVLEVLDSTFSRDPGVAKLYYTSLFRVEAGGPAHDVTLRHGVLRPCADETPAYLILDYFTWQAYNGSGPCLRLDLAPPVPLENLSWSNLTLDDSSSSSSSSASDSSSSSSSANATDDSSSSSSSSALGSNLTDPAWCECTLPSCAELFGAWRTPARAFGYQVYRGCQHRWTTQNSTRRNITFNFTTRAPPVAQTSTTSPRGTAVLSPGLSGTARASPRGAYGALAFLYAVLWLLRPAQAA